MFRNFVIKPPFQSIKDIFCIRLFGTVDSYRRISINNVLLKTNGVPIGAKVELRVYANERTGLSKIRIWHNNKFTDIQRAKTKDLKLVHF